MAGVANGKREARIASLLVEPIGEAGFRVTGGARPHVVEVRDGAAGRCDCEASHYRRGEACKHVLAVRRYQQVARSHPELAAIHEELGALRGGLGTISAIEARARLELLGRWLANVRAGLADPLRPSTPTTTDILRRWAAARRRLAADASP